MNISILDASTNGRFRPRVIVSSDADALDETIDFDDGAAVALLVDRVEERFGPDAAGSVETEMRSKAAAHAKVHAGPAPDLEDTIGPVLVRLSEVQVKPQEWHRYPYIPKGAITSLVGPEGAGKSFVTCNLAAHTTNGWSWPDGSKCPQGNVIFVTTEDSPSQYRTRLEACGADLEKIHILTGVRVRDENNRLREVAFDLLMIQHLESAIRLIGDVLVIVVDPAGSFIGGRTDSYRDNEVRSVLAPLATLAEKYGIAVLLVIHRRKARSNSANDMALGSKAFTAISRAVNHITVDRADDSIHYFAAGKCNLAKKGATLQFSIVGDPPRVEWSKTAVQLSADDLLAIENGDSGPGRPAAERDEAVEWLRAELADMQEHKVDDLREAAKAAGLRWRTVQRARNDIGAKSHRTQFGGGYVWRLPR